MNGEYTKLALGTTIHNVSEHVIVNPVLLKQNMNPLCFQLENIEKEHTNQLSSILCVPNFHNRFYVNFCNLEIIKNKDKHKRYYMFMSENALHINYSNIVNYYLKKLRSDVKIPCDQILDETNSVFFTNLDIDDLIKIDLVLYRKIAKYILNMFDSDVIGKKYSENSLKDWRKVCDKLNNLRFLTNYNFETILSNVTFLEELQTSSNYDDNKKDSKQKTDYHGNRVKDLLLAERNFVKYIINHYNYEFVQEIAPNIHSIKALFYTISSEKIKLLQESVKNVTSTIGNMSQDYDFTNGFGFKSERYTPEMVNELGVMSNGRINAHNDLRRTTCYRSYMELYVLNKLCHYNDVRHDYIEYEGEQLSSDEFGKRMTRSEDFQIKNIILFKIRITPTKMQKHIKETTGLTEVKQIMNASREKVEEIKRKYEKAESIVNYIPLDGSARKELARDTGIELILKSTKRLNYFKLLDIKINKNWAGQFVVFSNDKVNEIYDNVPKSKI